jgi:hypothetical protein
VSLRPPEKVQKLQAALHAKAKGSPTYRFYALYDKVYRADILLFAYRCCKANGGAPGVDGQDFADIESYGVARWLGELTEGGRSAKPTGPWTPTPGTGSVSGCVRSTRFGVRGSHASRTNTWTRRWGW